MAAATSDRDLAAHAILQADLELRYRRLHDYWTSSNPLRGMTPTQRDFHEDPHTNRLIRKANKIGGTFCIAAEVWSWMLGTHPHNDRWRIPSPCTVLYVVADLEDSYADDVCTVLRELEPAGALDPACTYDQVRGYYVHGGRGLLLANGSKIIFRSGKQSPDSLEGIWADVVVVNEPPRRKSWGGITRAAALRNAPIIMAFTCVGQDLTWARHIVEVDPVSSRLWGQTVIKLCRENAPWRSQEDIDVQIANCAPWEREQRVNAAWEGLATNRSFDAFSRLTCVSDQVPAADVDLVLGLDHGEKAGHEAALLVATWRDVGGDPCAYVLAEYMSPGATTPEQDASAIQDILTARGISLMAIKKGVGDVNTAGKSAAGQPLNRLFQQAFQTLARASHPPFPIGKPRKGAGSILRGVKVINFAFRDGRLTVHPDCEETIRCLSQWGGTTIGDDKQYTHFTDALRYILTEHMDTSTTALKHRKVYA